MSVQGPSGAPPRQERSRASTERVLESTTTLIAERGLDKVTIAEVARHAKVSVGAIYGRFGDKESLLLAVQARFLERTGLHVADRLAALSAPGGASTIEEAARALVRLAVDIFKADEALLGQLIMAVALRPTMRRAVEEMLDAVQAALGEAVARNVAHVRHPRPELAVMLAAQAVIATLERQVQYGPFPLPGGTVSWDDLAEELGEMVVRYLGL